MDKFGLIGQQGNVYFGQTDKQDAVQCVLAVQNLSRTYDWLNISVHDIRMLRIKDNNDLKPLLLSNNVKMK
jgi:virulence-associated protein VapD